MLTSQTVNRKYPNWQKLLEIRNSLLEGVPTNAQLTIRLLRLGEQNNAPLPPPPYSGTPPPDIAHENADQNLEHLGKHPTFMTHLASKLSLARPLTPSEGATEEEIADAIHPDPLSTTRTTTNESPKPEKKKRGSRIMGVIKGVTKGGIETLMGTDRLKAAAGAPHAKNRLGVLKRGVNPMKGPVQFPARYKGKKGHAYITTTQGVKSVSWTAEKEDVDPAFSVAIKDITEIKKMGGLGWKTKLLVGWATDREIADGILVVDSKGEEKLLTAIALREELFNRLVALGDHVWEAW